ncbi:MAG TPA: hypothetical protein VFO77_13775 [Actinoplanes sp.]|nr:hypothetical protein [Actinoplanes sp.]
MFATIKNLIPEPRQADHLRRYVGRHREPASASNEMHVHPGVTDGPAEDPPAAESGTVAG